MRIVLGLLLAALVVFLAWPAPIRSRAFHAADPPALEGPLAVNRILEDCERISEGEVPHSDKLLVDAEGRIFAGDDRGRVVRLDPDGAGGFELHVVAEPGGMPMELAFAPDGALIVADHHASHFSIDPSGNVSRIPTLDDAPRGTAGVAVGRDGVVYYGAHTDELDENDPSAVFFAMLEAGGESELRAWDPRSGEVRTLATGLYTPVGVELSANEDFVAVAEFFAYRVTRHWLSGPKAGTTDRLVENLPGFVDGLGSDGQGTFYLAIPGPRDALVDFLHERPWLKDQVAKLLPLLLRAGADPGPTPSLVLALDEQGRILRSYHDPERRKVDRVTTAELHAGHLYLGSIAGEWIARCPLP